MHVGVQISKAFLGHLKVWQKQVPTDPIAYVQQRQLGI